MYGERTVFSVVIDPLNEHLHDSGTFLRVKRIPYRIEIRERLFDDSEVNMAILDPSYSRFHSRQLLIPFLNGAFDIRNSLGQGAACISFGVAERREKPLPLVLQFCDVLPKSVPVSLMHPPDFFVITLHLVDGFLDQFRVVADSSDALNHEVFQPIRAGAVIGTHNGTILNADRLFKRYRLRRAAETDSEFIFRLADKKENIEDFTVCARDVRGGMSAVFTRTSAPNTVLVIKGNKPLTLWYHNGFRAVFYSSEEWPLTRVIGEGRDVIPLEVAPYTLSVFDVVDLMDFRQCDLYFKGRMRSYSSWGYDIFSSTEL